MKARHEAGDAWLVVKLHADVEHTNAEPDDERAGP
jgi:hypothetical protein